MTDNLQPEIHWCDHLFDDIATSYSNKSDPPSSQPIPEQNPEKLYTDLIPSCVIVTSHMNSHLVQNALLALMDLGSSFTLIHHSKLPSGCNLERMPNVQYSQMAGCNFQFNQHVYLTDSHLPEFLHAL